MGDLNLEGLSYIPLPLLERAKEKGLTEAEVARRWAKYATWHAGAHGAQADYLARDWQRHISFELLDRVERTPSTSESRAAALAQDSKRRQALEDAAYAREAMTFRGWCALLRRRIERGEKLTEHEMSVDEWARLHKTGGLMDFAAWNVERIRAVDGVCPCPRCTPNDINKLTSGIKISKEWVSKAQSSARNPRSLP